MTRVVMEVRSYGKRWVFLRWPEKLTIFTLPRKVLRRGFATAERVLVEIDEESVHFDGVHFVADVELLEVVE